MNHTYLLVWNKKQARYTPAPETARRCGKSTGMRALSAAVIASVALTAHALPGGGQISAGQGSVAQSGSAMTVTQQSQNLALNWQSFGIRAGESVVFAQPNASAIALNRVLGPSTSQILGSLSANGQVWILNPNGVLFGSGAQVDVGGLIASTLSIGNSDFLGGKRTFAGNGGTVTNQGRITAADGGYVALLGGRVSNEGIVQARLGTVALGAGKQVTLDFAGDKLLNLQVDKAAVNALAQNKQLIQADGGRVLLTARGADSVLTAVVNNEGVIEARSLDTSNGTIRLLGGMNGGTVKVGGSLDASAPASGDGGFIETSGAHVKVSDTALVTTAAIMGRTGQWLIDPTSFTIAASDGDVTGNALATQLANSNIMVRTASGAKDSGDVNIRDNITWSSANSLALSALHSVKVSKAINNSGTGDVTLRADNTAACVAGSANCGTVSFNDKGRLGVNSGAVNIYYNPAGSNNAADANGNGPSYATPTDYSGKVTLNGGSSMSAWMLVNDVNQLQAMNTNLSGSYALGKDIDALVTASWNGGAGLMPVGSFVIGNFTGSLDGGGHVVSRVTINRPDMDNVGLFGSLGYGSSVSNVGLSGGSMIGQNYVGGLAGYSENTISNSHSTGNVSGVTYVGGLVGYNVGVIRNSYNTGIVNGRNGSYAVGGLIGVSYNDINDSYSTGNVSGGNGIGGLIGVKSGGTVDNSHSTGAVSSIYANGLNVGGLIGQNTGTVSNSYSNGNVTGGTAVDGGMNVGGLVGVSGGKIENSYSSGNVSGGTYVGGLVGYIDYGTISNSYSTGNVSGGNSVGGLVAYSNGTIELSYSTGAVSSTNAFPFAVGGLVGWNNGSVINSYWDTQTSSTPTGVGFGSATGATGLTTAQMKQQASFIGFDFDNIWWISEGNTRPFLRSEWSTTISNAHQLQLMAMDLGGNYTLARDIDMGEMVRASGMWNTATGFVPIGNATNGQYAGIFDGANHTINGLTINRPAFDSGTGLFGSIAGNAVVQNVALTNVNIEGGENVGALVGNNFGLISNSSSTGAVRGGDFAVGGLVATNNGVIGDSHSTAAVSPRNYYGFVYGNGLGGLVAYNNGEIWNSYSAGAVSGTNIIGGLAAVNTGGIWNSYSTGNVSGGTSVGGLVASNAGSISNGHSTGDISGANYVGGLVGDNEGSVSKSYSSGAVSAYGFGAGGLVGRNTGTISNSYSNANASGGNSVGGLVGWNYLGSVSNSYSTGVVSGANAGGLIGSYSYSFGTVDTSYWDSMTSGQMSSAGGTPLTTGQMKQQASFVGFDFANTWGIVEGVTYPFLVAR